LATHRIRNTEVRTSSTGLLVLLDTSFVLTCLRQRLDYEPALQELLHTRVSVAIIDGVMLELQRLARVGKWNTSSLARIALDIVARGAIELVDTPLGVPDTDTSLLTFALGTRRETAIATVDSDLRRLLGLNGLTVISPRSHSKLTVFRGSRFRPL